MSNRIKKDDLVKIISGSNKGTTGKVVSVLPGKNHALIEGVGKRTRKMKPSQLNPAGGVKEIHVPVSLSKLALVTDEKTGKTSRVGYKVNTDGVKVRTAKQQKNKEIK